MMMMMMKKVCLYPFIKIYVRQFLIGGIIRYTILFSVCSQTGQAVVVREECVIITHVQEKEYVELLQIVIGVPVVLVCSSIIQ